MTLGTLLTLVIVGVAASIGGSLGRRHLFDRRRSPGRDPVDLPVSRPPRPIDWTGDAGIDGSD
jgi:hypothetical protein